MINLQITAETIAAAAKLAAPEPIWRSICMGDIYDLASWKSGLDGSTYNSDVYGCDWLIGFCREKMAVKPSIRLLQMIEKIIREERK